MGRFWLQQQDVTGEEVLEQIAGQVAAKPVQR
jgi:hypothetical protein